MTRPFIQIDNLHKTYRLGQADVPVLRGVNLSVAEGEFVAVVGASGSGKSTLLHLMGALDRPDRAAGGYRGRIIYDGKNLFEGATPTELDNWRNRELGFVFQFYHLLPELSVLENVLAPLMIRHSMLGYWQRRREFRSAAEVILEKVGLTHRLKHKPNELSGGEMQRAAIARALVAKPEILLADEPTGNLDASTGQEIMGLLRNLNEQDGLTIVMVTHDENLARSAHRLVRLSEGRLELLSDAA